MRKLFIIILIMGLCVYDIALIFSFEKIYPEYTEIECICEIIKEKEEKDYYNKYIVKIIKSNIKCSKNTKLILYLEKNKEMLVGDILNIKGQFEKGEVARNYKGFNYRNYLKQHKIYGIIKAENVECIGQKKSLNFIFGKIRTTLEQRIDKLYVDEYSKFLKGLLIGDKSELDEEIIKDFRNASISHILSISGLHISFIVVCINSLLKNIINSKKIRNVILIFFLVSFFILTGASVSCMRACIMNVCIILSSLFRRKNNFYLSFLISFIFIIIFNPYNIFNIGMWLSYGGTIGIVLLFNFIYKILYKKLKLKNKILIFILKSFILSISAQILIFPMMIYIFNTFSLSFFVSNIIISFLIGPIIAIGYASIFMIFPISKIFSNIEKILILIIFKTAKFTAQIPFSKVYVVTPSLILIILYYLSFFIFLIYFKMNKVIVIKFFINPIKFIVQNKNYIFNKIIRRVICIILIFAIIFNINKFDFSLKIYFIDVGQGDCTLIKTPTRKNNYNRWRRG